MVNSKTISSSSPVGRGVFMVRDFPDLHFPFDDLGHVLVHRRRVLSEEVDNLCFFLILSNPLEDINHLCQQDFVLCDPDFLLLPLWMTRFWSVVVVISRRYDKLYCRTHREPTLLYHFLPPLLLLPSSFFFFSSVFF